MKKFTFRLDGVLEYFRQQEAVQSGVIAMTERELMLNEARKKHRMSERDDNHVSIRRDHRDMTGEELDRSYAHAEFLERAIAALEIEIHNVTERLEHERATLIAMSKRRRMVEELRSRRLDTFEHESQLLERNLLDEVNARRVRTSYGSFEVGR